MKTVSQNISLPEPLHVYALKKAEEQDLTISGYFQDLLRRERDSEKAKDLEFLSKAMAGAPEEEPPQGFFDEVAKEQRRYRRSKS